MHNEKAIERYAIDAYVKYGVRIPVPLSAGAKRELARIRRSVAGLAEVVAAQNAHRLPFESVADHTARVLQVQTVVRANVERIENNL